MRTTNVLLMLLVLGLISCGNERPMYVLDKADIAGKHFGADSAWYRQNIPFFECSDKEIEEVYYYRWKLYKAHIRNVGTNDFVITEFINHVSWDRDPWCTINAASMHHIYEGRWLRDERYVKGYINYLYQHGGNNRRYSESIADATYAAYLVNVDEQFLFAEIDSMKRIYDAWRDHWDSTKNLYFIPAMPDATEYTIASIDASGGKAGFDGGDAFRPTLNSYMYGNAKAIATIAAKEGDDETAKVYNDRANDLRQGIVRKLWNDSLNHFCDRFKQNNQYVKYWDFIRGRELAGMIPWYFNLPPDETKFNKAWLQVTDTTRLLGAFGLRTNEPSYEYYFRQYVIYMGQRGSQWNGPSWPYQTSQVMTAMANVLHNYHQDVIQRSDYIKLLRQYTRQHYLPNGRINLVENYDPNLGGPIVYYYWSNHYLHSSYNNLIISGLCGLIPSAGDTLEISPLVDSSIKYFYLDNLKYHGHNVSVIYDEEGTHYNQGKGVMVYVDGKKADLVTKDGKQSVVVGTPRAVIAVQGVNNIALNIFRKGYPTVSASVNTLGDSLYQAVDGRIWYFPEISNRWTTAGSKSETDWYEVDFGEVKEVSKVILCFFEDAKKFAVPDMVKVESDVNGEWRAVAKGDKFAGNTANTIEIQKTSTSKIRIVFTHRQGNVALTEVELVEAQ